MKFKKYIGLTGLLFVGLGIVLIIFGAVAEGNIYTSIIYLLIGVLQTTIAGTVPIRSRGKSEVEIGNLAVQHNWWILSTGIASVAVLTSPFFKIPNTALMHTAIAISAIWVIWSLINIYVSIKLTKARLVV